MSGPRNTIGAACAELVADLAFRRRATRVHALGPRVSVEMLAEIAVTTDNLEAVEDILSRYATLNELALAITNGDKLPALPTLREVA